MAYHKSPTTFIAGHGFIYIFLSCKKPPPIAKSILTRSLKKVCPNALRQCLTHHSSLLQSQPPFPTYTFIATSPTSEIVLGPCPSDVDSNECAFTSSITSAFNESAPLRRITLSTRHKPWVSPHIKALMKSRDHAYKAAHSSGSANDFARFRLLRAEVSNSLDTAKN